MARVLPFSTSAALAAIPADAAPDPAPRPRRALLGDVLVTSGALDPEGLRAALDQQRQQDARLGHILVINGAITGADLRAALSRQSGYNPVDLRANPVDPALLSGLDPYLCLDLEAVPWRETGGVRYIALSNPDAADAAIAAFGGGMERIGLVLAPAEEIRLAVTETFKDQLRDDARDRCPADFSCRDWARAPRRWRLMLAAAALAATVWFFPVAALGALICWILVANAATMGLRFVALFSRLREGRSIIAVDAPRLADFRKLPRVSILVPLLREERVAQKLTEGLAALDYPAALLDIKLVLEEYDTVTRAALDQMTLPPTMEVINVPADAMRTKPRAMNYALPLCRGEIIGVYDAEDRPEPDQIRKVVDHLRSAPPDVACVQGYLDIYNTKRNWLSRCFTIEYAIWFRVILLGVQRLGIPIPLGGTTVFFRRDLLERIGGWDSHNVTEDADLGMRLARFGYRCEMIQTTTLEEATITPIAWIKQRSRWLKGYAITWATHMRQPVQLWRDLGTRGFLGFQVLFLGALTSYLSIPLFWLLWPLALGFDLPLWGELPPALRLIFFISVLLGQAVMLTIATIAVRDSGRRGLLPWVLSLPLYWPLGAVACYRALTEMFYAPFYWHKTEHGVAPEPIPEPAP